MQWKKIVFFILYEDALVQSDYSREEMSAKVSKIYQDFVLSPFTQESMVNNLMKQRELERGNHPNNQLSLIRDTPQGSYSIITSNQPPQSNGQQFPTNYQQLPSNYPKNQMCTYNNFLHFY